MNLSAFLEKLNSRKLLALVMFVAIQLLDPELARQTSGLFITYVLGQSAVDAATNLNTNPQGR